MLRLNNFFPTKQITYARVLRRWEERETLLLTLGEVGNRGKEQPHSVAIVLISCMTWKPLASPGSPSAHDPMSQFCKVFAVAPRNDKLFSPGKSHGGCIVGIMGREKLPYRTHRYQCGSSVQFYHFRVDRYCHKWWANSNSVDTGGLFNSKQKTMVKHT